MITKKGTANSGSVATLSGGNVDRLLEKEWLLANSRGGFACSTTVGCNTRRYHGLLTGSLHPPSERINALSCCREVIEIDGSEIELSNFEFAGQLSMKGAEFMTGFSKDIGAHFDYTFAFAKLRKSLYLTPDSDTVAIVYDFSEIDEEFDFSVRPLTAMRDFHSLGGSVEHFQATCTKDGIIVQSENPACQLVMRSREFLFTDEVQQWNNFLYRKDKHRGQDCSENLWSPGIFTAHIDGPARMVLWADFGDSQTHDSDIEFDLDTIIDSIKLRDKRLIRSAKADDETMKLLCKAASQFVVQRDINGKNSTTILAGYPWFLDWGRDTFISLQGLMLCTGRTREACSILETFAAAVDEGMIPNRFDDYNGPAHYNSIDASLWFVHAAFEYRAVCKSKNQQEFSIKILPAIRWIIDSYLKGTRFGIRADGDGLITGGDIDTQLTWMDAKCDGTAFTPRYGKAVEINALWYSALARLAEFYKDKNAETSKYYGRLAEKCADSFCEIFWNKEAGCLNDCILPDGTVDDSLRPNQIFAVSLPFSPLDYLQQKQVVDTVAEKLLTPYGLRTLAADDKRYRKRYEGSQYERDSAYHNGTVWPYLIGHFIGAYLNVNDFSDAAKAEAKRFLQPLLTHFSEHGCIGSISEVFDASRPHRPAGCFAQAWSVAEVLRAWQMVITS